ncbi:MAG: hypothetical protein KatS3mg077_1978 [Candidatus Binatia bacterium]|nr:MAG: hypothetical protein KatS3mg077_1978 [Candidatus Binatia bacterium]
MDEYTRRTRTWLDQIYAGPPPGFGEYVPHSPIHGLSLRSQYIGTYAHLYAVLYHLARYEFSSVLDLGAGEGFLGRLIREIFAVPVFGADLSLQACRRARSQLPDVVCAHAVELPFRTGSVDAIVSVNTLEHIVEIQQAVNELARVARSLLVVALPHARSGQARELPTEPHAHVSLLTRAEMQVLFGPRAHIYPSLSKIVRPLYALVAEDDIRNQPRYRWLSRQPWSVVYRLARAAGSVLPGAAMLRWLCRAEYVLARLFPWWTYETIVVVELAGVRHRVRRVPAREILDALLRPPRSGDPLPRS